MEINKSLPVFKGKTEPLSEESGKSLISILIGIQGEKEEKIDLPKEEYPFTSQVVSKRIEAMNLPITFTDAALVAVDIFAKGNPGMAMLFLIDALNKYEDGEVTLSRICKTMYPMGFYTEKSIENYIDGCKVRKYRWSEIY